MARRKTTTEFIEEANKIHGNKYDYSKVKYQNLKKKILIICPKHGEFNQLPDNHLSGQGCPICANNVKLTTKDFIKKAKKIHGNQYEYGSTIYVNNSTDTKIFCRVHGFFSQKPKSHLSGSGCPKCAPEKISKIKRKSVVDFLNKANKIHNHRYKYQNIIKLNTLKEMIEIICPRCGPFRQTADNHLAGHGCPKCAGYGFNPGKEAILYYLKDTETGLYKIGISNRKSIEERFGKAFCSKRAIALKEQSFLNGQEALEYEQEILEQFAYARCINSSWPEKLGGRTEFFKYDILGLDLKV